MELQLEFEVLREFASDFEGIEDILIYFGLLKRGLKINCYQFIAMCSGGCHFTKYIGRQKEEYKVYYYHNCGILAIYKIEF